MDAAEWGIWAILLPFLALWKTCPLVQGTGGFSPQKENRAEAICRRPARAMTPGLGRLGFFDQSRDPDQDHGADERDDQRTDDASSGPEVEHSE